MGNKYTLRFLINQSKYKQRLAHLLKIIIVFHSIAPPNQNQDNIVAVNKWNSCKSRPEHMCMRTTPMKVDEEAEGTCTRRRKEVGQA